MGWRLRTPVLSDSKGQGLMEYVVIVLLVCVASIAITKQFGTAVKERIEDAKVELNGLKVDRDSRKDRKKEGGAWDFIGF